MLNEINSALPGLNLSLSDVAHVYCGFVPAEATGSSEFAHRPWIVNHAKYGGPSEIISAAAVKFTTGPTTADTILALSGLADATKGHDLREYSGGETERSQRLKTAKLAQDSNVALNPILINSFCEIGDEEAACTPRDLVCRRLGVINNQQRAHEIMRNIETQIEHSVDYPPD
jgi:hypothetical protein